MAFDVGEQKRFPGSSNASADDQDMGASRDALGGDKTPDTSDDEDEDSCRRISVIGLSDGLFPRLVILYPCILSCAYNASHIAKDG